MNKSTEKKQSRRKSYFPLLIEYQDTNKLAIVYDPKDIQSGRTFKVKKTKVC